MIDPTHQQHPHRRQQHQLANNSNNNGAKANKLPVQVYLTNCKSFYSCIYCRTHLADHDELVSRSFQGNNSRAYLFNAVINIRCGPAVQRELNTGHHAVADIYCANCETNLGWKYEKAYVSTQKYKEGKFIIELAHVVRENRHLELDKGNQMFMSSGRASGVGRGGRNSVRTSSTSSSSSSTTATDSSSSSSSSPTSSSSGLCGGGVGGRHNSLTPSSPADSTTNEEVMAIGGGDDDDDDELMFPFYDDMFTGGRSSYPNSLSLSHHNRLRRSLYLDSTPYDWKYFATANNSTATNNTSSVVASTVSSKAPQQSSATEMEKQRSGAAVGRSSLQSTSSTASSRHDDAPRTYWRQQSCCIGCGDDEVDASNVDNESNNGGDIASNTNNETQFEIELHPINTCCQQAGKGELRAESHAAPLDSSLMFNNKDGPSSGKVDATSVAGDDDDDEAEEFYDCCTEPSISSPPNCSRPNTTRPC